jgi:hypothetical protein
MSYQNGVLSEGALRVWRYQRVVWWFFFVNLVLSFIAAVPMSGPLGAVADHSLESQRLSQGFDLFSFVELAGNPDVGFWSKTTSPFFISVIFFFFALLITGGALEAYHANRKLNTTEYFHACGLYFWRLVRLLFFLLVLLLPIVGAGYWIDSWSSTLSHDSPSEKLGFWVEFIGMLFLLLLLMVIRLWFDMAQVRSVAESEPVMRRNLARTFRLTFGNFFSLFSVYFSISFLAWLVLAGVLWFWPRMPGQHSGLVFLKFEIVLLFWTATRFWQRASETVWYERWLAARPPVVLAPEPVAPVPVMAPFPSAPSET